MKIDIKKCTGCGNCEIVCPTSALKMRRDGEGFLYPDIDNSKCIDCEACINICYKETTYLFSDIYEVPKVYAVKRKDDTLRKQSQSGGLFSVLAEKVILNGGIVYGAVFNQCFYVKHARVQEMDKLASFKGSKYVQSDTRMIAKRIESDLKNDKEVIFSGTPCQCKAMKYYMNIRGISINKLILCDLVCNGVPSPLIWKEYIKFINLREKGKIKEIRFRDKDFGWGEGICIESFIYRNKKISCDYFAKLFGDGLLLRQACYDCQFSRTQREADITMGDYWGIDKAHKGFKDNNGVSLALINTLKGELLFESIKEYIEYRESTVSKCRQPRLCSPNKRPREREEFWDDYNMQGFQYIIKKYAGYKFINFKLKSILNKGFKKHVY